MTDENGDPITTANTVGQEYVGQQITVSVELVPCSISCWGFITVEDKIGPKIWNCDRGMLPEVELDCADFDANLDIDPPTVGGLCNNDADNITFLDDTSSVNCFDVYATTISRTWYATDQVGNISSCAQTINIRKFDILNVVIPDDWGREITNDTACDEYDDLSPDVTGWPTGIFCPNIQHIYNDIVYPQCGRQMKMLRDWFVIDWCTGESISKGQIIKLYDNSYPVGVCDIDTLNLTKDPNTCLGSAILNPFKVAGFDSLATFTLMDECVEDVILEVAFLATDLGTSHKMTMVPIPYLQ